MMDLYQRSPIVRAFIEANGMRDPGDAIVDCAIDLLEEVGIDKPPVNLHIVASFQRVKEIQRVRMSHAGRLIPVGSDYVIQVKTSDKPSRQNFTAAHEIGHTILLSYRAAPSMIKDRTTGFYPQKQEEEYLCDLAAAELLMPSSFFWPLVESKELSLDLVEALSQVFGSSRTATAIWLVHTGLWPCAFVIWNQSYCPPLAARFIGKRLPKSFRDLGIKYVVYSPGFDCVFSRYLTVQPGGCLARCFRYGGVVCGEERFELCQRNILLYVMAKAVNFRNCYGEPVREIFSLFLSK
jgi:IrrE N-terminal-like domain